MRSLRKTRDWRADESGSALVEFSVSAVLLLTLIFGIMEVSRALYVYHFISYAAQSGTRFAIVRGSTYSGTSCDSTTTSGGVTTTNYNSTLFECDATADDITAYVKSTAPPGVDASQLTVTPTWPASSVGSSDPANCTTTTNAPGCLVKVVVSYPFSFIAPFLPTSAMTMRSTSQQVIQQ